MTGRWAADAVCGPASRTFRRAREAIWRHAPAVLPTVAATSSDGHAKTSVSRKTTLDSGSSCSSTTRNARVRLSATSADSSGPGALATAWVTMGSGSQGPT